MSHLPVRVPLLNVQELVQRFGGVKALDHVGLTVYPDEIVSLIGPNGAGKTTFFNVLTGIYAGDEGTITFAGNSIRGLLPHTIVSRGISRTYQNIRLFPNMTAIENVMVGCHTRSKQFLIGPLLQTRKFKAEEERIQKKSLELLDFVGLMSEANILAKNLSYGAQRKLEIARALGSEPRLIILDEPTAGMNPTESRDLVSFVRTIRDRGVSVLLIEHQMRVVMDISDRVYVFDHGVKIAEGRPQEIVHDARVIKAYLGQEAL
jgi:branched-chain amino acid transport system ATP-binding protein